jgi:hypothetical protein
MPSIPAAVFVDAAKVVRTSSTSARGTCMNSVLSAAWRSSCKRRAWRSNCSLRTSSLMVSCLMLSSEYTSL